MVSSAAPQPNRTFYLSDFTRHRGDRIVLGNIFTDPLAVNDTAVSPISEVTNEERAELENATSLIKEGPSKFRESSNRSWSAELWAQLLAFFKLNALIKHDHKTSIVLEVAETETMTVGRGVESHVRGRITRNTILKDRLYGPSVAPIYMITGIKYVKGLKIYIEEGIEAGGSVGAGGNVSGDRLSVSAGGGAGGQSGTQRTVQREFSAEEEVVFAYRLARITAKKIHTLQDGFMSPEDQAKNWTVACEGLEAENVLDAMMKAGFEAADYGFGVLDSAIQTGNNKDQVALVFPGPNNG